MNRESYTKKELAEIEKEAKGFKLRNFFRLPCIIRGNKVASRNPDSRITNWSTITECFSLSTGRWVYLIYAYPFSIIHRLLDGLAKWATGKYCVKVISRKKWKEAFIGNSFIPIIPVDISSLVAMPYVENENLFDVLTGRIGNYTLFEKKSMIRQATEIINKMHDQGIVWGELIVQNMIRSKEGKVILCDTETKYYRGLLVDQKASDWLDFICSVCGSMNRLHPEKVDGIIREVTNQIQDGFVRETLRGKCIEKITWLHCLFFSHTRVRLACTKDFYNQVREKIVSWG